MTQLVIAEKPSIAQSISKALGVTGRCSGYLENSTYIWKMFLDGCSINLNPGEIRVESRIG